MLSRERKKYNRKTGAYERVPPTMAQLAKEIGVATSTLRRWKNQGVTPKPKSRSFERLKKAASRAAGQTSRELTLDKKKHRSAVRFKKENIPLLPAGHRRELKRYVKRGGRVVDSGNVYESTWVNYAVHGWNFKELSALLTQVWRAKRPFQFIYEVPAGGQLPKSGDKPPRNVRRTTRAATAPVNPYAFRSQTDLVDFLNRYIDFEFTKTSRRMIYVAVDDNPPREIEGDEPEE